jgi:hypothetical protein
VTTAELIDAARGVPWVAGGVLTLGFLSWVVERIAGLSGPATALHRAWSDRELRALRREAHLRAERRRITAEEESAVIADLRDQVADLATEIARLRAAVRAAEEHHRQIHDWAAGLLRTARNAGVIYVDPPTTGEQPALALATSSRNPAPGVPAPR